MSKKNSLRGLSQDQIREHKPRSGNYTSYNSLAGKVEIKSVSEAMGEYIREGFRKISNK